MKFEKFLKNCGARGTVVSTESNGQFLKLGAVILAIPAGVNVLSISTAEAPDYIETIFEDFANNALIPAELTGAELPTPDASPSKIKRIFENEDGGKIAIDNKTFGIIERSDHAYTFTEKQDDDFSEGPQDALVITSSFGYQETITGIILDEQYYYDKLTNKEDNK